VRSEPIAKPLLRTVLGERQERPPIWIMRQAGRYLPEYRAVRDQVGSFLELCYTPALASEVTLQPIRRFDLDAAILFSDILVIPDALGQEVRFETGEGPVLGPLDLSTLKPEDVLGKLEPVLETVSRVRAALAPDKALIGFCGSPWTVATYMIGGRGSPDQAAARLYALQYPEAFDRLIDMLVEASTAYLVAQFKAGAEVVQLFESWAMNLDAAQFEERVIGPNARIVEGVRKQIADAPIIGFPRGAAAMLPAYAEGTRVSALGLDFGHPPSKVGETLPAMLPLQGNLDPLRLVAGGEQLETATRDIISAFRNRPHIFNLGHGIVPETPIANVERLIEIVRKG
jgi:uroporphyrinogen decarboxylase